MENQNKNQQVLLDFFEKLKREMAAQIEVLSLRPKLTPSLSSNFEGDFDYIVRERDYSKVIGLIYNSCKKSGINFIVNQRAQNKKLFYFFIEKEEDAILILEFWTAIEFSLINSKKSFFSADTIFNAIKANKITEVELRSLLFVTHLFHKNKKIDSKENRYRFEFFLKKLAVEHRIVKDKKIYELLKETKGKTFPISQANSNALSIMKSVGIEHSNGVSKRTGFLKYRIRNKLFNLKKLTPIIGPDGVGKGSVSRKSLSELKKWVPFPFKLLYRVKILYRLRLSFVPNWKGEPNNKSDEKIGNYIFFTAFMTIRLLGFFKPKKMILLDRYFMDYLGTPIRYLANNQVPKRLSLYKLLLFLTPVPNNVVFLGCKDASLIARKNELPIISVDFLQKLYCEFIVEKKVPVVLFISTENPLHNTSQVLYDFLNKIDK